MHEDLFKKTCPFFSIAFARETPCIREKCALWNRGKFECGLMGGGR